jgi:CheY-like chemotaxis protein
MFKEPFRKTILVLEQDERTREILLQAVRETTRYHVVMTRFPLHALQLTAEMKPDLLLLASHLDEITGIELYDLIQKQPDLAHIPALILGGDLTTQPFELSKRNLMGLSEPVNRSELIEAIDRLLS